MGKTVKSRTLMSIASFLFVVAFCLVANGSIPKIYESYKQKVVAQQAATKTTQVIKKEKPTEPPVKEMPPMEEPVADDDIGSDDANVYDIDDSTSSDVPAEEPVEEPAEEEEEDADFDFDFDDDNNQGSDDDKKSGGFLDAIISFITGLIEKISKLDILAKFKELLAKILAIFGITL